MASISFVRLILGGNSLGMIMQLLGVRVTCNLGWDVDSEANKSMRDCIVSDTLYMETLLGGTGKGVGGRGGGTIRTIGLTKSEHSPVHVSHPWWSCRRSSETYYVYVVLLRKGV
jgi:hypothetical protein